MRHEWRDNIWLVLGLTVVAIAVWIMILNLTIRCQYLYIPLGADIDNVCKISVGSLSPSSPEYIDRGENEPSEKSEDLRSLIVAIRQSPYVEAAAFSRNALPYQYSYLGYTLQLDLGEEEDTIGYAGNIRIMSPDMVKVLKLKSLTGKSEDELVQLLRNGETLISNCIKTTGNYRQPEEMLGKKVVQMDENNRVGDIVQFIRRSDFDNSRNGTIIISLDETDNFTVNEIAVRVKPGMREKFRQEFENTPSMQKRGNTILYDMQFLDDAARSLQRPDYTQTRMTISLSIMIIVIVALGFMGVFWFRIQQRISETAIRKVCGATNNDIFRRVISEGLILVLTSAMLMVAIGWFVIKATILSDTDASIDKVIISGLITLACIALIVVVFIWIPARNAMKIEPAIAIKDE